MRLEQEILMNVAITMMDTHDSISVKALLASGVTGLFIDKAFVH